MLSGIDNVTTEIGLIVMVYNLNQVLFTKVILIETICSVNYY